MGQEESTVHQPCYDKHCWPKQRQESEQISIVVSPLKTREEQTTSKKEIKKAKCASPKAEKTHGVITFHKAALKELNNKSLFN